ncbi:unnamed protein product [Citrullus colocynthis]|uniref:Uncharacterized protein n=1 Tax=Citrullus colocynthis TaxID=252529 RepID=A0ABP0XVW3_9ROSI
MNLELGIQGKEAMGWRLKEADIGAVLASRHSAHPMPYARAICVLKTIHTNHKHRTCTSPSVAHQAEAQAHTVCQASRTRPMPPICQPARSRLVPTIDIVVRPPCK